MRISWLLLVFCSFSAMGQSVPRFAAAMQYVYQIPAPLGFTRIPVSTGSFAYWLRHLPLRSDNIVYLYNGVPKPNQSLHYAVINISTGTKDLQQCADMIMRLRAEYFFEKKQYDSIVFKGNQAYRFADYIKPSQTATKEQLMKFMEKVFINCGTYSLDKQLKQTSLNEIQIGDVFIKGGAPGHAEIVVDIAVSNTTGQKIFMLAEGYMPAQDAHILLNEKFKGPWYELKPGTDINTPTWTFTANQLKRW